MIIELENTSTAQVAREIRHGHRSTGTSAMAFTLVVVTQEKHYDKVIPACLQAGGEHPSRILVVVHATGQESRLDAEIRMGEGIPGDLVTLRMSGELAEHSASVVLPLLLPDSKVVVWWPNASPESPSDDQIGALATRRITDAAGASDPVSAVVVRARYHSPGDTDLTWTRLTPWRALLAAAVDQYPGRIRHATVEAAKDNAPAELMAAWLQARLGVEVERKFTKGPGMTGVRLTTAAGDIALLRPGKASTATYLVPGQPQREVALKRREINELITEELRRMDPDLIFHQATQVLLERETARAAQPEGKADEK
ncbi:MAG: glucose-6-phosphate dehydrogenase assembly protein OpcA [Luteococcus japonicus]|uniref:glucose-6-phosphate dehydrogenase assembly protein OpcA n=1 Tax=Luteococcus sp. TaxID=1969402 RepID=UPI0026486455|nr:glucose-6-phosphate dehydrogenase assembly protein OpcA [Luteococcus sp.]MDN5564489.1 glucose-6-phosphate dehydrogenase assembly protein OpcA [Luteococcus sp.]